MKLDELIDEEMYCLVAPDGNPQVATLAPDWAMCIAMTKLLGDKGIGQSVDKLLQQGYQVLPVKVTMIQNGTAEQAFNIAKANL